MSAAQHEAEPAYTTDEAAAIKRVGRDTILRAIRSTDPDRHLRAKRVGKGYRIPASALEEWFDGLEDA